MRRSWHRSFPVYATLLYALVCGGGPRESVLCIGADGHIVVETRCGETTCCETGAPVDLALVAAEDDACCECRDVPLTREGRPMVLAPKPPVKPFRADAPLAEAALPPPAFGLTHPAFVLRPSVAISEATLVSVLRI